ncbi:MAG: 2-C-methyl-D-erythritol 4-phosphate cytidylyltransferase [Muribaculaceae bacterium]|nr:2-C-methyl-D-erythritol 4-phosphate cytidylyltransferase [Muribaculaceae bacterium]
MVTQDTYTDGRNVYVVIVAAGSGSRFGSDIPKQFLPFCGIPVLCHSIATFHRVLPAARIFVVLSDSGRDFWDTLVEPKLDFEPVLVPGGASRTESVRNALDAIRPFINDKSIVMIHDGARPLVAESVILATVDKFRTGAEAVVPVCSLTEAIAARNEDTHAVSPVDRAGFVTVRTPQSFNAALLAEAYDSLSNESLPDDAAVYTKYTAKGLHTIEDTLYNIKITNPADIEIAEIYLHHKQV